MSSRIFFSFSAEKTLCLGMPFADLLAGTRVEEGVSAFGWAGLRGILGVDSRLLMSEMRDVFMLFRCCFFSLSALSSLSTAMTVSSTGSGEVARGLETGSELERMLEKDITPAARLGVYDKLSVNGLRTEELIETYT